MKKFLAFIATAAFLALAGQSDAIAADVAKGEKVFKKCKACHNVDNEKNKVGPHLVGIMGRKAGTLEGYKYSKAMKGSDLVWDETTLSDFLEKPKKFMKGTKMAFPGLKKQEDRDNVIEYMKSKN